VTIRNPAEKFTNVDGNFNTDIDIDDDNYDNNDDGLMVLFV
jgi:hypothetical protein